MKFVIVLFAVVAAASAYPGVIPWAAPVSQPWQSAPAWPAPAWPAPAPAWPSPTYVKVAVPQVHAPEVHHVINIPQQQPIPPVHPQPLNIKIPHAQSVRIPYHGVKIQHPHLVGVEHYQPQPEAAIKVVKAAVHHPWD